jgi:uncharacterized protein (DUF1501 family)
MCVISRRVFVRNGALAVVGTVGVPSFLARAALAGRATNKRLVVLFQRGAADGLNLVVPHGERAYYALRPSINIPKKEVIDLDGFFGLHPSMSALHPLWEQKHLAIVPAAGSPDPTRSHFEAQDYMESGTPGLKSTLDGWLNRALCALPAPTSKSAVRAISLGHSLPRTLSGGQAAVAVNNVADFGVGRRTPNAGPAANSFEVMYQQSVDTVLHGTGKETLEAVKMLKSADPAHYKPTPGANYPPGHFGDSLKQQAQLIKANLGVQVTFADIGGWDHHVNEGGTQGQIANIAGQFAGAMAAFWTDLGDLREETVVVTMSEFGRAARENGNRGTDHGHANAMFVLGSAVKGGRISGRWPGLEQPQLHEGRDLAVTTDFRQVLGELVTRHMGAPQLGSVFPGFDFQPEKTLDLIA